jgi:serine protease AprX
MFYTGQKQSVDEIATYIDDSGTSMAAPHVFDVIAAFLSIRREFISQPKQVKRIFLHHHLAQRAEYLQGVEHCLE